jgi:dTDP-4-dehydrorhamnose 3,5-epimerase
MKFQPTEIPDIILIEPKVYSDLRGYFMESYQQQKMESAGINFNFVQDNQSKSCQGTLRGLHYQINHPQGKLIRVILGEVFDVAVDLRRSSSTFGKWVGVTLSAENKKQLWIPPGFAHGFYTISEWAEVFYKATDYYSPENERSIIWNDANIGIKWPLSDIDSLLISPKDLLGLPLNKAETYT